MTHGLTFGVSLLQTVWKLLSFVTNESDHVTQKNIFTVHKQNVKIKKRLRSSRPGQSGPLYVVIIRGAMLIDISSWNRSLQAYGIRTREICQEQKINNQLLIEQRDRRQSAAIGPTYLRLVAAASALVRVSPRVSDGHQSTQVAHVDLVRVGRLEQTLSEELSRSVSDLTVALHLPEPQAAVPESDRPRQPQESKAAAASPGHQTGESLTEIGLPSAAD